jgi:hypothetical protein
MPPACWGSAGLKFSTPADPCVATVEHNRDAGTAGCTPSQRLSARRARRRAGTPGEACGLRVVMH